MTTELALWILTGSISLMGALGGLLLALGGWAWRRQVAQSDGQRERIEKLERRADRAEAQYEALRDEVERMPTLEGIRAVIREEIDRAKLHAPSG